MDTNIIVLSAGDEVDPYAPAKLAMEAMVRDQTTLVITPQVIFELWVVATRPKAVNGLGLDALSATKLIHETRQRFLELPEPADVVNRWLEIVLNFDLKGKRIHDAHLLTSLELNGIPALLTANSRDFPPVPTIAILTPESLL